MIPRARCHAVADRGSRRLAAHHALQAQSAHQPLDRAARHLEAFPAQLPPELARAIDLEIFVPDMLNMLAEQFIPACSG